MRERQGRSKGGAKERGKGRGRGGGGGAKGLRVGEEGKRDSRKRSHKM